MKWFDSYYEKLGNRKDTFKKIFEYLDSKSSVKILIETGTARIKGNWEGDGQSTLLFDKYAKIKNAIVYSLDINEEAIDTAKSQTEFVEYIHGDSIKGLNDFDSTIIRNCSLLYLDSYDLDISNPFPSSFHHMKELCSVYSSLPKGCLIVVDDCYSDEVGKHILINKFFKSIEVDPLFNGYQTGWIKT